MGYLFIDTRQTGASSLWWLTEQEAMPWLVDARAQEVLACISQHMPDIQAELKGVVVVPGPGRFSSVRVGVLYANLLARWFRVPLYGVLPEDVLTEEGKRTWVHHVVAGQRTPTPYVAPVYDREPNITTPHV